MSSWMMVLKFLFFLTMIKWCWWQHRIAPSISSSFPRLVFSWFWLQLTLSILILLSSTWILPRLCRFNQCWFLRQSWPFRIVWTIESIELCSFWPLGVVGKLKFCWRLLQRWGFQLWFTSYRCWCWGFGYLTSSRFLSTSYLMLLHREWCHSWNRWFCPWPWFIGRDGWLHFKVRFIGRWPFWVFLRGCWFSFRVQRFGSTFHWGFRCNQELGLIILLVRNRFFVSTVLGFQIPAKGGAFRIQIVFVRWRGFFRIRDWTRQPWRGGCFGILGVC